MDARLYIVESRGSVTELQPGDAIDIPVIYDGNVVEVIVATVREIRAGYDPADGIYVPGVIVEFADEFCQNHRFDDFFEQVFMTVGRQTYSGMVEDLR